MLTINNSLPNPSFVEPTASSHPQKGTTFPKTASQSVSNQSHVFAQGPESDSTSVKPVQTNSVTGLLQGFGRSVTAINDQRQEDEEKAKSAVTPLSKFKIELQTKELAIQKSVHLAIFITEQLKSLSASLSEIEIIWTVSKKIPLASAAHMGMLLFKPIRAAAEISSHAFQIYRYGQAQKELAEVEEKNRSLLMDPSARKLFEQINHDIEKNKRASEDTINKTFRTLVASCAKVTTSLEQLKSIISEQGQIGANLLKNSMALWKDVDQWLNAKKITAVLKGWKQTLDRPEGSCKITDTKKVNPQDNPGKCQAPATDATALLLAKRKAAFEHYVKEARPKIQKLVDQLHMRSFDVIVKELAKQHIHLKDLDYVPCCKEEWLILTKDPKFLEKLSQKRAEYQEARDMMHEKATRSTFIKKIDKEIKMVAFQNWETFLSMAVRILEIGLCLPVIGAICVMKFIEDNLLGSLPFSNILKLINPDLNYTLVGVGFAIIGHLYYKSENPHAYSWEGYRIRWTIFFKERFADICDLGYKLKLCQLALQIEVFEKLLLKSHERELTKDDRYIDIIFEIDNFKQNEKRDLKILEKELKELRLKDAKFLFTPQASHLEEETIYQRQYREKHKNDDAISILQESFCEISTDSPSSLMKERMKKLTGIDLETQQNTQPDAHCLENLFSKNAKDLVKARAI